MNKTKTQKILQGVLKSETAKSHLAKHSPEMQATWIATPRHPRVLSCQPIFPFAWPLAISYFSEKSFIVVILTRNFKPFSEERIKLFL